MDDDTERARGIEAVIRVLDLTLDYIGAIPETETLRKAAKHKRPLAGGYPSSPPGQPCLDLAWCVARWLLPNIVDDYLEFFMERRIEYGARRQGGDWMKNLAVYEDVQQARDDDDVVVRYAPLVKRIAQHLAGRLPPSVLVDDLIQAGMIGLLEAARQYDPAQGASFHTYAAIRVRGAMIDEIRRLDWTPRSVHRKAREVASALSAIENRVGREAKDREVAQHLGLDLNDYHQILQDAAGVRIFSIDEPDPESHEPHDPPGHGPVPIEILEQENFLAALAAAIQELPEREQLMMQLYYDEELNLKEIGQVLGVSESRVSQIHGRIALKLRALLADWI